MLVPAGGASAPDSLFLDLQAALAGRYSLLAELGRGGTGIVYLAREVRLDRLVALKVLPPDRAIPALRERFLREARTAAKLSQPNIIPIHAVDEIGEFVFFAMAYVDGESLSTRIARGGPMEPGEASRLLRDVAWALAYAHAQGVVHRDIKPDNILIERGSGRPLVADFGIAHVTEGSGATAVGQVLGTQEYMSPEQASGEEIDGRSDIYSLGVVGFFALSGGLPFHGPNVRAVLAQHITQPAPPLLSAAPTVPAKLAQVVDRCLAKAPSDRYKTAEALAEAIDAAVERRRQLPAPLERWLVSGDELRLRHVAVAPVVAMPVLWMISLALGMPRGWTGGTDLDETALFLAGIAGPFVVYTVHRLIQTRGVLRDGYGVDDLRAAVRAWAAVRAKHVADDLRPTTRFGRIARWILESALGVGLVALGAGVTRSCAAGGDDVVNPILYGTYTVVAAAFVGARLIRGPGRGFSGALERLRERFWTGKLGRWVANLAGIGLRPAALQLAHRPTEVALGSAASTLFEALPREMRQQLTDVPETVRRLEARAQAIRRRMDELAALEDAGKAAHAKADGADLAARRHALQEDVRSERERAEQRLSDVVTALETIRIDLLRLKAGSASATSISADLRAAEEVGAEVDAAVEGRAEVERLLAP